MYDKSKTNKQYSVLAMHLPTYRVDKTVRPVYMGLIGKLSLEHLVSLLEAESEDIIGSVTSLLDVNVNDYSIASRYHSELYRYGFQGVLFDEARPENHLFGGGGFIYTELTRAADAMMCLLELDFSDPYSVDGGSTPELKAAHVLVMNTASVRAYVDCYRLKPGIRENTCLSLHELALLAQMKVTTIRNRANPKDRDPIKTFKDGTSGETRVLLPDAIGWLERNTRYQPTAFPAAEEINASRGESFTQQEVNDFVYSHLCN